MSVDLGKGSVGKLFFRIALPALFAQVINLLYNIVDRMYVGSIPETGTLALAGLGICFPIIVIVSAFSYFIGIGGAPLAAIKLGEGKQQRAEEILNNGFVMILIFSVVLTAVVSIFTQPILQAFGIPDSAMEYGVSYLKIYSFGTVFVLISVGLNSFINTQGRAKIGMITVLLGALLNIGLDPLFIFVFHMGVSGAALATVLAQAASAIFVVSFLCSKHSVIRLRFHLFRLKSDIILPIIMLGITPFLMETTDSASQIIFNIQLRALTNNNEAYTAGMSIILSAFQFVTLPLNGLGNGAQPLISYNYGAGNFSRLQSAVKYFLFTSLFFSATAWAICLFAPGIFSQMFSASAEVAAIVSHGLPLFMLGSILFVSQWSMENTFLALGESKISLLLSMNRKLVLLIPLAFLLPLFMGVDGVFLSEGIGDLAACIVTGITFFIFYPRILKRRKTALNQILEQKEVSYESK